MRIYILLLITIFAGINGSCSNTLETHAIQCITVGKQKLCFVREVWGFNGDQVTLTTNDNVCHQPSEDFDYVSKGLRSQDYILAKVEGEQIFVAEKLYPPQKMFPVKVVIEPYDPLLKPSKENLIKEGYQQFDLSKSNMTWCFNDMF